MTYLLYILLYLPLYLLDLTIQSFLKLDNSVFASENEKMYNLSKFKVQNSKPKRKS